MEYRRYGRQVLRFEKQLINALLCLLLAVMIVLACMQIVLRTFFSGGLLWADPLLRYLVLWCGLLGAVVATRENKHIAIDAAGYLVPEPVQPWIRLIIDLFSSLVAAALTWASVLFIRNEWEFGSSPLLSVPSWIWNLIFPMAFGLITFHFLLAAASGIRAFLQLFRGRTTGSRS